MLAMKLNESKVIKIFKNLDFAFYDQIVNQYIYIFSNSTGHICFID